MIPRRHNRTRAALLTAALLSAFASPAARQTTTNTNTSATDAATPRDAREQVRLTVTVMDKQGRYLTGLPREAFTVFEGKEQREVAYFSDEEEPQSVGVVFDVSKSMGRVALDEVRGALVRLMRQAHPENEYFVIGFGDEVHTLTDWTRDGKTLIEALNKLGHIKNKKAETAFNDAVAAAIDKVKGGPQPRRVLIVVSDGVNNTTASKTKLSRVRDALKRTDVTLFAVAASEMMMSSYEFFDGRRDLEELAGNSGGWAYFPRTAAEIAEAFTRLGLELHHQYTLGFTPAPPRRAGAEEWRKLEVKVRPPRLQGMERVYVRGREGFYAASK